jgi:DNA repair protein RecO (recombination protein O)
VELTSAFILHHRPYRETSSLVDVLTRDHGRVSLVARGLRQTKKRSSPIQIFQPVWLSWYGRGDLVTLSQIEKDEPGYRLLGNASLCGLYMNELLVKLLPVHEAEPDIFDAYRQALSSLQQKNNEQITLRLFEKALLSHLGYGLALTVDAESGEAIEEDGIYIYYPDSGPRRVFGQRLQNTVSGRSLRHLEQEAGFDELSLKEIKHMMRSVINYYLGGRPLHSRQLFAGLNQFNTKTN